MIFLVCLRFYFLKTSNVILDIFAEGAVCLMFGCCRRRCCLFLFVYYIKCTYLIISVYIIHCNITTSLSASVYYLAASQNKYNQTLFTADNGLIWKDDGVYYFDM